MDDQRSVLLTRLYGARLATEEGASSVPTKRVDPIANDVETIILWTAKPTNASSAIVTRLVSLFIRKRSVHRWLFHSDQVPPVFSATRMDSASARRAWMDNGAIDVLSTSSISVNLDVGEFSHWITVRIEQKFRLCSSCGCNIAGSLNNIPQCDKTGKCLCKKNVEGDKCNQCKQGYFGLELMNELGCSSCFCYGHSDTCSSSPGYSRERIESSFDRDTERWTGQDSRGNTAQVQYNSVSRNLGATSVDRDRFVYLIAPEKYLGDKKYSYDKNISFSLQINGENNSYSLQDIVFQGNGLQISLPIYGQGNALPSSLRQRYTFRLNEEDVYEWTPKVGIQEFVSILSNLTAIKVRVTYTSGSGYLDDFVMETATKSSGFELQRTDSVETCSCPPGYSGQHCEICSSGYRHDPPGEGKFSKCVPCICDKKGQFCDSDSGRFAHYFDKMITFFLSSQLDTVMCVQKIWRWTSAMRVTAMGTLTRIHSEAVTKWLARAASACSTLGDATVKTACLDTTAVLLLCQKVTAKRVLATFSEPFPRIAIMNSIRPNRKVTCDCTLRTPIFSPATQWMVSVGAKRTWLGVTVASVPMGTGASAPITGVKHATAILLAPCHVIATIWVASASANQALLANSATNVCQTIMGSVRTDANCVNVQQSEQRKRNATRSLASANVEPM